MGVMKGQVLSLAAEGSGDGVGVGVERSVAVVRTALRRIGRAERRGGARIVDARAGGGNVSVAQWIVISGILWPVNDEEEVWWGLLTFAG